MTFRKHFRLFALALLTALLTGHHAIADESRHIALIFSTEDANSDTTLSKLVAGIEAVPDATFHRILLQEPFVLAQVSPRPPLRIALNTIGNSGGSIAVLYPESAEPYRSVFSQIVGGIENKTQSRIISIAVNDSASAQDISNELQKQDVRVVIALGRGGLKTAVGLSRDIKIIAGGLVSPPENENRPLTLLSLAPDPALLFDRMKTLMPGVRRIHVVFDPRHSAWLIRIAREAARNAGLELSAVEASDLKSALHQYQGILANADVRRDALWLPQDPTTVEDSTVLPIVLQECWTRNLALFSSSLSHVKRGALFTLYPNTGNLGRNLAVTAIDQLTGNSTTTATQPLRDVLAAINVRTANHLGLNFDSRQQPGFDLVFTDP